MTPPEFRVGSIIRYAYLREAEARAGQEHGKERPCLVLWLQTTPEGSRQGEVAPISTRVQTDPRRAVEISAREAELLGLGVVPSWIIAGERNRFWLPSPDLTPPSPATTVYPQLSRGLRSKVAERIGALERQQAARLIDRVRHDEMLTRRAEFLRDRDKPGPTRSGR